MLQNGNNVNEREGKRSRGVVKKGGGSSQGGTAAHFRALGDEAVWSRRGLRPVRESSGRRKPVKVDTDNECR